MNNNDKLKLLIDTVIKLVYVRKIEKELNKVQSNSIYKLVLKEKRVNVSAISKKINLARVSVYNHLNKLIKLGLVKKKQESNGVGKPVYAFPSELRIKNLKEEINNVTKEFDKSTMSKIDKLIKYIEEN